MARPARNRRPNALPAAPALSSSVRFLVCAAALAGAACATYNQRTAAALAAFEAGRFEQARAAYAEPGTTGSDFLAPVECGTVALTAGDWAGARENFDRAVAVVQDIDDRALISATEVAEGLASLAINESVKEYPGEGYERVQVHVMLAMTYLAGGNLDGVWVEVRRANELLEHEQTLYEKQYQAGGLGHFMSAVSYELRGEIGDAYIDYKRMQEKGVGGELAGQALVRLAQRLGRDDELPGWIERFGPAPDPVEGGASVVLIAGLGLGPFKVEHTISLPLPHGVVQWSVPSFRRRPQPVTGLDLVELGAGTRVSSSLLEDLGTVAQQNLDDRIAWLAAKSAARAALKYEATRQLQKEHDAVGWLAGGLFTALTERADLRSWLTVPDGWHGARMALSAGTCELALEAVGGETLNLGRFELEPGETLIVLARTLGTRLYAHPIGGRRIDAAAPPPADTAALAPTPPVPQP